MVTEVEERYDDALRNFNIRLHNSKLTYDDGFVLIKLAENMGIHYGQVRKSRDKWRKDYYDLKKSLSKKDPDVKSTGKGYGRSYGYNTSAIKDANRSEDGS